MQISKRLHPAIIYLLSLPFIGLLARIVRISWKIVACIVAVLFGKRVTKHSKEGCSHAITIKQDLHTAADEQIQEKQLKDHFLVMASHELKTPMTTILGQAQLMLRRLAKMPELSADLVVIRTALESIDGQTRRLNGLIDDVLDLYTIRAGKVQLRLRTCNLAGICHEVVAEQRFLTGRAIELKVPLKPVILQADDNRLSQVVVNLVSNAIKYSGEGSPVKVLVDQYRDIGIIEVCDSGPGIPKEQQAHIFEPFYRGPHVQASAKSGLGLGLAICKDIVERHSGRIWCRSHLGKGSTFIVELPLKQRAV